MCPPPTPPCRRYEELLYDNPKYPPSGGGGRAIPNPPLQTCIGGPRRHLTAMEKLLITDFP